MMNLSESPILDIQDKMIPLQNYGVGVMSMGNLVSSESAVVWRGPMVMGALNKLIFSTNWGDTDYLVIDTPPGMQTHILKNRDETASCQYSIQCKGKLVSF